MNPNKPKRRYTMTKPKKMFEDPTLTERRIAWSRSHAQARFRNELWELSWEDFLDFWNEDRWPQRGRTRNNLVMIRKNPDQSWSSSNCCIVDRYTQLLIRTRQQMGLEFQSLIKQGLVYEPGI